MIAISLPVNSTLAVNRLKAARSEQRTDPTSGPSLFAKADYAYIILLMVSLQSVSKTTTYCSADYRAGLDDDPTADVGGDL